MSPTQVDAASGPQEVTVTAVITDDLSGVSLESAVELYSPSVAQWTYGFFNQVSGDTYAATIPIAQYAEQGIWRDWIIELVDNAGNYAVLNEYDLMTRDISMAVGVGSLDAAYARVITLRLTNKKAYGDLTAELESSCFWFVPVLLERKTSSGWKRAGSTLTSYDGTYKIRIGKDGRYRATAAEIGLGTPTLTTCSRAAATRTIA